MYQGPTLNRPAAASARSAALGLGPHLEVVVDDRHLAVEHEVRVAGVPLEQGDSVSISSTSARRKSWYDLYHSRSQ